MTRIPPLLLALFATLVLSPAFAQVVDPEPIGPGGGPGGGPDPVEEPELFDAFVLDGIDLVGGEVEPVALVIDPILETAVRDLAARLLIEIRMLDDDTYQDDEEIEIAFYSGIDQDDDAEDDFNGDDVFDVVPTGLAPDGTPVVNFTPGDIVAGAFMAGPATLDLSGLGLDELDFDDVMIGDTDLGTIDFGALEIEDATITGTFALDGESLEFDAFCVPLPSAVFEAIEAPFPASLLFDTVLDWMLDDSIFGLGLELDVDLDDDGENDAFSAEFALTAVPCQIEFPPPSDFLRGDVDGNGFANALLDALHLLEFGFVQGDDPPCMEAADVDDNGSVSVLVDSIMLLNWGFNGGDVPADPGPEVCGPDPAPEELSCFGPVEGCD